MKTCAWKDQDCRNEIVALERRAEELEVSMERDALAVAPIFASVRSQASVEKVQKDMQLVEDGCLFVSEPDASTSVLYTRFRLAEDQKAETSYSHWGLS